MKLVKLDAKDVVLVRLSLWSVTLVKVQLTAGLVHTERSMLSFSSPAVVRMDFLSYMSGKLLLECF